MRRIPLLTLLLIALVPLAVGAESSLVRFKGGIGVIPVSSGVPIVGLTTSEVVNRNFVRGVPPAGQIWVISDLDARVEVDGQIKVDGRGLLLGGGNNIGTNANASVFATLFCGNVAHSTDTAGVPLEPNGDFRIDDVLTPVPPTPCATPVLLIRNANGQAWFAAGIPKL